MTKPINPFPGLEESMARAQRLANANGEAFGVWEYVGCYGRVDGDIPAHHTFMVRSLNRPDPADVWALVGCVDPQRPERDDARHTLHGGESEHF